MCLHYLTGFCPLGKDCEQAHPKFEVSAEAAAEAESAYNQSGNRLNMDEVTCYRCSEKGHFANKCPNRYVFLIPPIINVLI